MKRNARRSLLTRFFGIYSIGPSVTDKQYHLGVTATEEEKEEQYFIIMNAVFPAEGSKFISTRFDLKGSTVGRYVCLFIFSLFFGGYILLYLLLLYISKTVCVYMCCYYIDIFFFWGYKENVRKKNKG